MFNKKANDILQKPPTSAMEDYLEAIFNLANTKRVVRVKDIAKRLKVKMPTVTNMLKTLSERGFIDYEKYEYIELTRKGHLVGKEIHRRHDVLRGLLINVLKINPKKADEKACKMEHGVSPSTLDSFVDFMEFLQSCPRASLSWLENFEEYRLHGREPYKCIDRMKEFSNGFKGTIESMEDMEKKDDDAQ